MWWITFIYLCVLNQPCIARMNHFIVVDKLFDVLLDSVSQYSVEDFALMFIVDIGLQLSFLVVSLPGFGIMMMLVS